jgi:hypothetical protein
VRQRVSPWATVGESTARRWRTVRHWLSAVQQGRLLKKVRPWAPGLTARQAAAHVVHVVAGYALPCAAAPPYYVLAFWGAARAACGPWPSRGSPGPAHPTDRLFCSAVARVRWRFAFSLAAARCCATGERARPGREGA